MVITNFSLVENETVNDGLDEKYAIVQFFLNIFYHALFGVIVPENRAGPSPII